MAPGVVLEFKQPLLFLGDLISQKKKLSLLTSYTLSPTAKPRPQLGLLDARPSSSWPPVDPSLLMRQPPQSPPSQCVMCR